MKLFKGPWTIERIVILLTQIIGIASVILGMVIAYESLDAKIKDSQRYNDEMLEVIITDFNKRITLLEDRCKLIEHVTIYNQINKTTTDPLKNIKWNNLIDTNTIKPNLNDYKLQMEKMKK